MLSTRSEDSGLAGMGLSTGHVLLFFVVWLVTQGAVVLLVSPEVLQGAQIDTDGYMRLVRVRHLLDTGAWFDGTIPRSNWPHGEVQHWTRPLDVILLIIALPFSAFLGMSSALAASGALVSAVFHLAVCIAGVWVIRPLVPGPERFLVMPALLVQRGLLGYGTFGRADHHTLLFFLFVLSLGAWMRALQAPDRRGAALAAGALSGLGVWVSPEALIPFAVFVASGGVVWLLEGDRTVRSNRHLSIGFVGALVVAVLVERPPSDWASAELDRVSMAHLTVGLLVLGFWAAIGVGGGRRWKPPDGGSPISRPGPSRSFGPGWRLRATSGALGAAMIAVILTLLHPGFFSGPLGAVDPELRRVLLPSIQELQPLFPRDASQLGRFIVDLGPAFLLVPYALWSLRAQWADPQRSLWILLSLALLVYVPLAGAQLRMSGYAGVVFAILMVDLLRRSLERAQRVRRPFFRRLSRLGLMVGILVGFQLLGGAVGAAIAALDEESATSEESEDGTCSLAAMGQVLADPTALGALPRTIAASINFGPELLYRTPHRILAGPYHRNHEGIQDVFTLFTSTSPEEVRQLIRERQVDLVLLCPRADRGMFGPTTEESLYELLVSGTAPAWTRPVDLPEPIRDEFLLFEIVP